MDRRRVISSFALVFTLALAGCGASPTAAPTAVRQATATAGSRAAPAATATAVVTGARPAATATAASPKATATATPISAKATAVTGGDSVAAALAQNDAPHDTSASLTVDAAKTTQITLKGNAIQASGSGVTVSGSKATITAAGTYNIQGALADGQIIVNTKDKQPVKLILNGVTLSSASSAPIYVVEAKEAVIILADGSTNTISDAKTYVQANAAEDEPNAAIFATCDLTIGGGGTLTVAGNYNDGIASKDGLVILGGVINVTAADDGIRGKDYVVIRGASISVNPKGDGLKADNAEDATRGYIYIANGSLNITSGMDAFDAETDVLIAAGKVTVSSGGGYKARLGADVSAKGIKGGASVVIDGGTFAVDSADDALHSNASIIINGGSFVLSTGDDGMHADASLKINSGDVTITSSYEGLESALITINGGDINLVSSDDGVNVAAGNDGSGTQAPAFGGRPGRGGGAGQDMFANSGNQFLYINGGRLVVDAGGDGIDANGKIVMTDGVVIVNGPTQQMNGPLDHSGFTMKGGFLVAVGSSGMAQAPDTSSTQNALLLNFSGALKAGTLLHIQSSDGKDLITFAPTKQVQSIAFSSAALAKGVTYDVYYGGASTGAAQDGLYQGGKYSGGTKYTSFTVTSVVTALGARSR